MNQYVGGRYIRPLINCTRPQIEAYCEEKNLKPCIDQTNFENIYTRNKVRNELLPELEREFNPNIITGLNRLGDLVQEEEDYWEKELDKIYQGILVEEIKQKKISLDWKAFQKLEPFVQSKLIRYTVQKLCGTTQKLEKIHIQDIRTMCQKNIGNKYLVPYQGLKVEVKEKRINVMIMS